MKTVGFGEEEDNKEGITILWLLKLLLKLILLIENSFIFFILDISCSIEFGIFLIFVFKSTIGLFNFF